MLAFLIFRHSPLGSPCQGELAAKPTERFVPRAPKFLQIFLEKKKKRLDFSLLVW